MHLDYDTVPIILGVIALVILLARALRPPTIVVQAPPAPAPADVGTVLTPPAHVCESCVHFDLEEGQAALRQNPIFVRVMESISPADQSRRALGFEDVACPTCKDDGAVNPECGFCKGKGTVQKTLWSEPTLPLKVKWADMGACSCPALQQDGETGFVCWKGDGKKCQHFKPRVKLVALRGDAA